MKQIIAWVFSDILSYTIGNIFFFFDILSYTIGNNISGKII